MRFKKRFSKAQYINCDGERTVNRLDRFIKLLRVCKMHLPKKLQTVDVNVIVDCIVDGLGDDVSAAQCNVDFILFYVSNKRNLPDVKSLTWLLAHELSHFVLGHNDKCGKTNKQMKTEACEYQENLGMNWFEDYKFTSTYYSPAANNKKFDMMLEQYKKNLKNK